MKTCRYCGEKYEDSIRYWYNKYCCTKCFKTKNSKFNKDDIVYSYYDKKENCILTAVIAKGKVIKVIELYRPSTNGLYQYKVLLTNGKLVYRFVHQIFNNKDNAEKHISMVNKKREIDRKARMLKKQLLKEVENDE